MKYFDSRKQSGELLSKELEKYRFENTAVVALGEGAVVIGFEIAIRLHCTLSWIKSRKISLPGETDYVGVVDQFGTFAYNSKMSEQEIKDVNEEMHSYIDQEKINKFSELNSIVSVGGEIDLDFIRGHNVILVSDGALDMSQFDATLQFLRSIKIERLIAVIPVASVPVVDRLHISCDEIHCMSVVDGIFDVDHYYEDNQIPPAEELDRKIVNISEYWQ